MLLSLGYPKEKILISGNPNYDFIPSLIGSKNQKDDYKQLGLSSNRKTIVFGTQPDLYEYSIEPLSTLISLGENYEDIQLIIKVHPREDSSRYLEFQKKANFPIQIVKNMNIFSIIKLCDLFITFHSTTILDALILGKPVATFNFDNRENPLKFLKTKAIVEFKTPKETMELIPKILGDESLIFELEKYRNEFLSEQIYKIDGNAATRIVNSVFKIDNKKN
jgi:UDP-N-acetylglucosamine 2-epimerase